MAQYTRFINEIWKVDPQREFLSVLSTHPKIVSLGVFEVYKKRGVGVDKHFLVIKGSKRTMIINSV